MNKKGMISDLLKKYAIILVLIAMCVFFTVMKPVFINIDNILQVLRNISISGIVAIGMTFCLISGGLDLSVGTIQGSSLIMAALLILQLNVPIILAIIIGMVAAVAIGIVNGVFINELNVPPFITTLATMEIFRGIIYVFTSAKSVYGFPQGFNTFGQGVVFGIPIPVLVFGAIFVLGWLFLNRTTYGRYLYGVGNNAEVARLSGVNVKKVRYLVYAISAFLAGFSGIILLSRLNSGQPRAGIGLEFDAITAAVLGGVSISGGEGKLSGVLFGILIIGVLKNGLILMGVTEYYTMIITGLVLVGAVAIDTTSKINRTKHVAIVQEKE